MGKPIYFGESLPLLRKEAWLPKSKSFGAVYQHITGKTFNAHDALADTLALQEILTDDRKWRYNKDITKENLEQWIFEHEVINSISVKTKKAPTSGYVLQNYYRCQHNTRNWSPIKDPQQKLYLNPSARVKNTNCPFQMIVKIDSEGCCSVDIEWDHNHLLETLESSFFRDLSPQCTEMVLKLFESGHALFRDLLCASPQAIMYA
ncbi:hypothetical protein ACROYT_G013887 [Oculina patagonica]